MIVKNEGRAIEKCLESVKKFIDYWVIVDTGSTDDTMAKIRKSLSGIPGELHERPWKDFAHNRNEALQFAKNKGDYLLFIDADQRVVSEPNAVLPPLDKDAYFVAIREPSGISCAREFLVSMKRNWNWEGVIHELIVGPEDKTIAQLSGISIFTDTGDGFRSQDPKKYLKDAQILEEELAKDPYNCRNVFYLATCYRNAGESALALKYFQRRSFLGGFPEEVFISFYVSGLLQETLGHSSEAYLHSYYKAYEFRPTRAEPLYSIAEHHIREENFNFARLILRAASEIQRPNECQFVYDDVYEYKILLRLADCSYRLGKVDETLRVLKQLSTRRLPSEMLEQIKQNIKVLSSPFEKSCC